MKVTKKSNISGIIRSYDIDVTPEEIQEYENNGLAEKCFPRLNAAQREFMISGISEKEWNELLKEQDLDESENDIDYLFSQFSSDDD